jgi:hypothetical protein
MEKTRWYRITVQGTLPAGWTDRLAGMTPTPGSDAGGEPVTHLAGWLRDQAALAGVCSTLYELHLPIVSVTSQDEAPAKEQKETSG